MATTTTKKTVAKKAPPASGLPKGSTKRVPKTAPAADAVEKKAVTGGLNAVVYSATGGKDTSIALPADIFDVAWNADLVHQVMVGMQANARPTVANTKFRGEVSGGGKKPWKQKGTGRARHGSNRSPIWRGGGVTHGPRAEKDYSVKINRKMRVAALLSVLSRKYKEGEVIFVEKLSFAEPSTKSAKAMITTLASASNKADLATKRVNAALVAFATKDVTAEKSIRNIGSIAYEEIRNLNPVDVLNRRYLIIENPSEAIGILSSRLNKKA